MTFRDFLKNNKVVLDGGTGTLLQKVGIPAGVSTEEWNLTHPDELVKIHKAYYDAGSNIVMTNTFGVNAFKFSEEEIEKQVFAAVNNVKKAKELSSGTQEKFVGYDIGSLGRLLAPLGDLDFEDAVKAFSAVVKAAAKAGVDAFLIETMNDCYETKAALLAVKENSNLPVMVSNAYSEDGRLLSGTCPEIMVAMLEGMGADAIGVNCSLGPKQLKPIVEKYLELASVPVLCKPNAGLPRVEDGKTVFDVGPEEFAEEMKDLLNKGVRIFGGCCGTTPEYIKETVAISRHIPLKPIEIKHKTVITSSTKFVDFDDYPILIGERINPTGKKRLKQALAEKDINYILGEAVNQQEKGAHVLDVNVGAPEVDETEMLTYVSDEIQAVCDLPLQLDTSDPVAMEKALRRYNGKALINSVNGKEENMDAIFPLAKKYGGVVIALTLDENGIPDTAEGRIEIAKKILKKAAEYGIEKNNIVFDTLTMTVSADTNAANVTLGALKYIREEIGCHTSLGVSNVSFGLPERPGVNGAFFTIALENGLSAAIMNPFSKEMMNSYYTWKLLRNKDSNCLEYIGFTETILSTKAVSAAPQTNLTLKESVEKGFKEQASSITRELLKTVEPLKIVQDEVIPALNEVGVNFENKKIFLPQLLMSAEAAASAFDEVKAAMAGTDRQGNGVKIVIATVKGDIHDIGKNIVKLLLENYGFEVFDLGRDVAPELVVETAITEKAQIVGLSALMTTTVPAMEDTIKLLKDKYPECKTIVGGAVLTPELADRLGADAYGKDAMETVRFAQKFI